MIKRTEQIRLCARSGRVVNTAVIPIFDRAPEIIIWHQQCFVRTLGENGIHYLEAWCHYLPSDDADGFDEYAPSEDACVAPVLA
jgi:hypothetical protein